VNQSIGQMDEATQQNAALVEESAAAAGAMQEQATKLAQVVGVFKLDAQAAAIVAPATPAPAGALAVRAKPVARAVKAPVAAAAKPVARPAERATATADEWEEF
jgi:methyl-accepting chemotaxis protein